MDTIQYIRDESGNLTGVIIPAELWTIIKEEIREETLEILNDPELMKAIEESEADIRAGRVTTLEDLQKELDLPSGRSF